MRRLLRNVKATVRLVPVLLLILLVAALYLESRRPGEARRLILGPPQFTTEDWRNHQLLGTRNCDFARKVGLDQARPGEPGYWPHLDADNDGIACEPYLR